MPGEEQDRVPALELVGLVKRFGGRPDGRPVVDGVDLVVPAGAVLGLVGPNGAGKTTTLSMATGLLRPDGGTVRVLGHDVWADPRRGPVAAKRLLGVLPDGLRLFDRLSGRELVRTTALLHGLPRATAEERTQQLLDALGLADAAEGVVVDYSAGMTKKVALACALVHAPRLLVLDEPFEAVDPLSARAIRELLDGFVAGGGTVVLSSHVMELVERLCDRVAVVADGRVLAAGALDDVRRGRTLEERFVELAGAGGAPGGAAPGGGLPWLRSS
ncbi:ABC transporter ATP-binding protein [Pseudokineococcus lusitanus]|uniref:ABC-2 type transport system ATP-binding protein n=1 Tax=Pseudokineococcus lusitanus TaxID=763993 RepID=A0A3N1HN56_9ACTN|nr:ABC-2 type transport system ATP-binding protein [Pseudokineococcus lusitanus]